MKVFVAGATGTMGRRLVPLLVADGHEVVAMTRSPQQAAALHAAGAQHVVADALDRAAVVAAVKRARPEVVIHQLTGLTGVTNLKNFDRKFALTNRLRTESIDYLLEGARAAEASRFIAQSFGGWTYERSGSELKTEDDPLDPSPPAHQSASLAALRYLDEKVTGASHLTGLAFRYANFYGPGSAIALDGDVVAMVRKRRLPVIGTGAGVWSFVHIDDAAAATVAAVRASRRRLQHRRRRAGSRRRLAARTGQGGRGQAAAPRAGLAGTHRSGRGRRLDDDPDPRHVQREGQARAGLVAPLPQLPRGVPRRSGRPGQARQHGTEERWITKIWCPCRSPGQPRCPAIRTPGTRRQAW